MAGHTRQHKLSTLVNTSSINSLLLLLFDQVESPLGEYIRMCTDIDSMAALGSLSVSLAAVPGLSVSPPATQVPVIPVGLRIARKPWKHVDTLSLQIPL